MNLLLLLWLPVQVVVASMVAWSFESYVCIDDRFERGCDEIIDAIDARIDYAWRRARVAEKMEKKDGK